MLLNRYNAGSGMSMTGPSTLIPTQQPLETQIPTEGGPTLGKQQSHQGLGGAASRIKKQLRYNNKSGFGAPPSGQASIDSPKFEEKKSLNNDIETQEG